MSDIMGTLRALIRDELRRLQQTDLGVVTQVFPRDGADSKNNHQVNLKLRGTGVELHRVPVAVGRLGLSALPSEGDLMVVAFVGGDLNAPIAVGCLYDHEHHPPPAKVGEVVYQPPEGESSGVKRIHLELPGGATVTLEDEKLEIVLGGTSVTVAKDGDVSIEAAGHLQLGAQGDIEIQAQGGIKLSAQGNLVLEGVATSVKGQAEAQVKAPQITIGGNTQFAPS